MASCLGLYIENNLIKYAKVSKEKDGFRMDSYGIKFYSNINEAIEQIVQEISCESSRDLQIFNIICPIEQINPPTQNALKQFFIIGELGEFLLT